MTARPQDVALLPLPQELIDALGEYGCARSDGVSDPVRLHRWQLVVDRIKEHTRANVTAALASAQAREDELRAEVAENEGAIRVWRRRCTKAEARAERLEEALRDGLSGLNGLFASGDYPLTDEVVEIGLAIIGDMQAALSTNAATQTGETT